MKAIAVIVAAHLALTTIPLHGQEPIEEEFLTLEQEWTEALARGDSASLERLLGPDFSLIGAGAGTERPIVDRALYLRNALRDQWPRRDVTVLEVNHLGDVAVVRCIWRGSDPPPFSTAEPEAGIFEFLLTDIWVRRDDGWQVVARHSSLASPAP